MIESIRVGPFTVSIDHLQGEDRDKFFGTFSNSDMKISLRDKFATPQQHAETMLHELLHCIYCIMGVKPKDGEERIVDQMSVGLAMVIRDNPELIKWLEKSLR